MDDRSSHHSRLFTLATLLIEAFVLLHFVGVFSFMGPMGTVGLFVLAGLAFHRLRRAEEAIHPPDMTQVPTVIMRPRMVTVLVVVAGIVGLLMSLLVSRLTMP